MYASTASIVQAFDPCTPSTMRTYCYSALDTSGNLHHGTADATDRHALQEKLRYSGLELLRHRRALINPLRRNRISPDQIIELLTSLEQLERAGVPLMSALQDLQDEAASRPIKALLSGTIIAIENGRSLSEALAPYAPQIGQIPIKVIGVGEHSGCLSAVLRELIDYLSWRQTLRKNLYRAMHYPLIGALVLLGTVAFMAVYLVPKMVVFISATQQEISWTTRTLLGAIDWLTHGGVFYLAALPPLVMAGNWLLQRRPSWHTERDRLLLSLPIIGKLSLYLNLARFAQLSALLYNAGIPVLETIALNRNLMTNRALQASLDGVYSQLENGKNLGDSLAMSRYFPRLMVRMVHVGTQSGRLEQSLKHVGLHYTERLAHASHKLQLWIAPLMTACVGALLIWIVLAVFLPLFGATFNLVQNF